uniref:Gap junction protein n=1 Tax=Denticeps clupeoides TaxID=299321 RepID=A0AAY4DI26_9TELE
MFPQIPKHLSFEIAGKLWLISMLFLRILVLLFAGYPLYQDEQERFVCNTIQPGCANVCYDMFAPLSLFRFWLVQLTVLCLPYVTFVIYVIHKVTSGLAINFGASEQIKTRSFYEISLRSFQQKTLNKSPLAQGSRVTSQLGHIRHFTGAYILHLVFRILLEAGFGVAHFYLFGFNIPKRYLCHETPCTTTVDCYVSRPTEKTVMLNFMQGVAALSLLLNILDMICTVKLSVRRKSIQKTLVQKLYEEEQFYLSHSGSQGAIDTALPTAQELISGCYQKPGLKSSGDEGALVHFEGSKKNCNGGTPQSSTGPDSSKGNDRNDKHQEEGPEREGSEVALCPPESPGTPRSIRVSKRGRLKPPPPPRRDNISVNAASEVCTRRVGQYTLVEMSNTDVDSSRSSGQDKRSEWV